MVLTVEQRLKIYKEVYIKLGSKDYYKRPIGMCQLLESYAESIDPIHVLPVMFHFPEILHQEPPSSCIFALWFPLDEEGRQKRLDIVWNAIQELTTKIQENES